MVVGFVEGDVDSLVFCKVLGSQQVLFPFNEELKGVRPDKKINGRQTCSIFINFASFKQVNQYKDILNI